MSAASTERVSSDDAVRLDARESNGPTVTNSHPGFWKWNETSYDKGHQLDLYAKGSCLKHEEELDGWRTSKRRMT